MQLFAHTDLQVPEVSSPSGQNYLTFPVQQGEELYRIVQKASSGSADIRSLCPLWWVSALSQGHPGTAILIVHLQQPPTPDPCREATPHKGGLVVLQWQVYKVRIMTNNASSSFLTFRKNVCMHKPEAFILKSIVLIVFFGKINETLGRKK